MFGNLEISVFKITILLFRSIDSGSNTPLPFGVGGGGGDDAESSGGFSIHSLSKMAASQRQARVLIAAAAMGSQIATMEELTKNWVTGAPTSIQFLGKFCKVLGAFQNTSFFITYCYVLGDAKRTWWVSSDLQSTTSGNS